MSPSAVPRTTQPTVRVASWGGGQESMAGCEAVNMMASTLLVKAESINTQRRKPLHEYPQRSGSGSTERIGT
jgi:hypothetical protein